MRIIDFGQSHQDIHEAITSGKLRTFENEAA